MATIHHHLSSDESINTSEKALRENGFLTEVFETKEAVFDRIKELIPPNATVMNGSSRTLEEIGFVEYLGIVKHI